MFITRGWPHRGAGHVSVDEVVPGETRAAGMKGHRRGRPPGLRPEAGGPPRFRPALFHVVFLLTCPRFSAGWALAAAPAGFPRWTRI